MALGFKLFIALLCVCLELCSAHAQPGSCSSRFDSQRRSYPQERLCVITDRTRYQPGDRVWFRTYVVDAVNLSPVALDRYVYAELVDGRGLVVKRVRVMNANGVFSGYLDIPQGLYPSRYFLRCYTLFSASLSGYECIVPVVVGNADDSQTMDEVPADQPPRRLSRCGLATGAVSRCVFWPWHADVSSTMVSWKRPSLCSSRKRTWHRA